MIEKGLDVIKWILILATVVTITSCVYETTDIGATQNTTTINEK